mgnify:CR=1 FL=1
MTRLMRRQFRAALKKLGIEEQYVIGAPNKIAYMTGPMSTKGTFEDAINVLAQLVAKATKGPRRPKCKECGKTMWIFKEFVCISPCSHTQPIESAKALRLFAETRPVDVNAEYRKLAAHCCACCTSGKCPPGCTCDCNFCHRPGDRR